MSSAHMMKFSASKSLLLGHQPIIQAISINNSGMVQVIVNNFDADISSQNGKMSTHSLAVFVTQPCHENVCENQTARFQRIKKDEMTQSIDFDHKTERYTGPKQVAMPQGHFQKTVLLLKVLAHQVVSMQRASFLDTTFLNDILGKDKCPEFNGYNTANARKQGQGLQTKTNAKYTPLIDLVLSDPDTIMTV
jgi:hypothetical protein